MHLQVTLCDTEIQTQMQKYNKVQTIMAKVCSLRCSTAINIHKN